MKDPLALANPRKTLPALALGHGVVPDPAPRRRSARALFVGILTGSDLEGLERPSERVPGRLYRTHDIGRFLEREAALLCELPGHVVAVDMKATALPDEETREPVDYRARLLVNVPYGRDAQHHVDSLVARMNSWMHVACAGLVITGQIAHAVTTEKPPLAAGTNVH